MNCVDGSFDFSQVNSSVLVYILLVHEIFLVDVCIMSFKQIVEYWNWGGILNIHLLFCFLPCHKNELLCKFYNEIVQPFLNLEGAVKEQLKNTTKIIWYLTLISTFINLSQITWSTPLSRSAHWTPNFKNPNFFVYLLFEYFFQIRVLNWYQNKPKNVKTPWIGDL